MKSNERSELSGGDLLERCVCAMKPHIEKKIKRLLNEDEFFELRYGTQQAIEQYKWFEDYITPARSRGELVRLTKVTRNKLQTLLSQLDSYIEDQRFLDEVQEALQTQALKSKKLKIDTAVEWRISITSILAETLTIYEHMIAQEKSSNGGATTSYQKAAIHRLIELWYKISGDMPTVFSTKDTNARIGPSKDFIEAFLRQFDDAHPHHPKISGESVKKYIAEYKNDFMSSSVLDDIPVEVVLDDE